MKNLFLIIAVLTLTACNAQNKETQEINKTVPYRNSTMLVGKANKDGFMLEPFNQWFKAGYASYRTDESIIKKLKPLLKKVEIKVFMGTWCGDSKRETPRFYKILEEAGFKDKNLTVITVDRKKSTPEKYEEGLDIIKVPTFIFYKKGKEINRIVEYPVKSLEKDMYNILSGANYKHSYAN